MAKIATIHQPNYLPWIGLFSKICQSNMFIIADNLLAGDHGVFNRNKIRVNTGWMYLTVPIGHTRGMTINQIRWPDDMSWQNKHWNSIYANYVNTNYFKDYREYFEEIYAKKFEYIWQFNIEITLFLLKSFQINVQILKASELNIDQDLRKTDMVIALSERAGIDTYLSGPSGKNYLEFEKFPQHHIDLKFFKFVHPVYQQRYPGFEPNMSAIDLLFNMGPESAEVIKKSGGIENP